MAKADIACAASRSWVRVGAALIFMLVLPVLACAGSTTGQDFLPFPTLRVSTGSAFEVRRSVQDIVADSSVSDLLRPGTVIVINNNDISFYRNGIRQFSSEISDAFRRASPHLTQNDVVSVKAFIPPTIRVISGPDSVKLKPRLRAPRFDLVNASLAVAVVGFAHDEGRQFLAAQAKRTKDPLVLMTERSAYLASLAQPDG